MHPCNAVMTRIIISGCKVATMVTRDSSPAVRYVPTSAPRPRTSGMQLPAKIDGRHDAWMHSLLYRRFPGGRF